MVIHNRKAKYNFELIKTYEAGIVLYGSEIKNIRAGKCSIDNCYCYISNNEIYIKDSYVKYDSQYDKNNPFKITEFWSEQRLRKLLLHKKEINKLYLESKQSGYSIVLTKLYSVKGLIKAEIALAKGKHEYDKRETIKERDSKRELDKIYKEFR